MYTPITVIPREPKRTLNIEKRIEKTEIKGENNRIIALAGQLLDENHH
jgi:hypothetical protein